MKKRTDKHKADLEKGKFLYYQYYGSKFGMWHDLGDEYENFIFRKKSKPNGKRIFCRKRLFLDDMKIKLLNKPITVHKSYNNDYMRNYDFSDANIIARIKAI